MSETTKDYFNREKEKRLLLMDYLESSEDWDRVDIVDKILWTWEIDEFLERETDEDWDKVIDEYETDRDSIDNAVREYFEPLSINKWCRVNPYDNTIIDTDNCKYEILITYGWPNVWMNIDSTAELDLYWWGDHLSRDFGSSFANNILSFFGLE